MACGSSCLIPVRLTAHLPGLTGRIADPVARLYHQCSVASEGSCTQDARSQGQPLSWSLFMDPIGRSFLLFERMGKSEGPPLHFSTQYFPTFTLSLPSPWFSLNSDLWNHALFHCLGSEWHNFSADPSKLTAPLYNENRTLTAVGAFPGLASCLDYLRKWLTGCYLVFGLVSPKKLGIFSCIWISILYTNLMLSIFRSFSTPPKNMLMH